MERSARCASCSSVRPALVRSSRRLSAREESASSSSIGRLWADVASEARDFARVHDSEISAKPCRDPPSPHPSPAATRAATRSKASHRRRRTPRIGARADGVGTTSTAQSRQLAMACGHGRWARRTRHVRSSLHESAVQRPNERRPRTRRTHGGCVNMVETRPFSGPTPGTPMFDRLLLALDDSPAGEVATLFAAALARRTGATVHVLHVNEQLVGGNGVTLRSRQESTDLVSGAVRQLADAGVRAGGSVSRLLVPGRPAEDRDDCPRAISRRHRARLHAEPPAGPAVLGSGPGAHDAADRAAGADRALTAQGDLAGGGGRLDGRSRSRPRFPAQVATGKHAGNPQKPGRSALSAPHHDGAPSVGWSCTATS